MYMKYQTGFKKKIKLVKLSQHVLRSTRTQHMGKKNSSKDNLSNKRQFSSIVEALQSVYKQKIKPLEQQYHFDTFHSTCLTDADLGAKPMVLLLGQYSVGKSTFVKYVLQRDYPGINIGPEPTTDRFVAIMHGEERVIPGNAAAVSMDLPFTALTKFGASFLSKFQVSQCESPVLEDFTLIDTPGVLSGEKQRVGRAYEFTDVIEWFAERSDLILLIFDAHKLDISDEFKRSIVALRGHDEKIRVVLNKADMINAQQLMRVYGALMWSLGKVFKTPEVTRVYLGSFWDQPLHIRECEALLQAEQEDLLQDLRGLPRNATIRKINELVKRTRMARVHALIISHLKSEMPQMWGKGSKQNSLIENLEAEFEKLSRQHQLARGDFPDPTHFKEKLANHKIDKFAKLDKKMLTMVDEAIGQDLPKLMQEFPQTQRALPVLARNPFEQYSGSPTESEKTSPPPDQLWSQDCMDRAAYVKVFNTLNPVEGKVSGNAARPILASTGLDQPTLAKIWRLADWTKDGYLDADEFVVAMWLAEIKKNDWAELPEVLPETLIPKRRV
ncbi:P-loop containing nucleoside triphosphate hydrolase protein [Cladochytrium replicatum]|nr:P-loop containing nucleoside triphosphate hydrolase protein [Cladochytrium replicatum]